MTTSGWQPYREPLSATLWRTVAIALVAGGILAWRFKRWPAWLFLSTLAFWFSFGGHWVDLWFLNWLRPRLSPARMSQVAARVAVWFAGGVVLGLGVIYTMRLSAFTRGMQPPAWWVAGFAFVAVELVAHLALVLRGRSNFYNGEG